MIDVKQEVINKLDSLYPDIPIYDDEVPQGFKEPSFFIKLINGSHTREINTRYKRTYSFDIHYFAGSNEECESMANELYENMEYLLNYYAKGINMKHEIIDRVLHFFVDYKITLIKETEENPKLNNLEVNEYGK